MPALTPTARGPWTARLLGRLPAPIILALALTIGAAAAPPGNHGPDARQYLQMADDGPKAASPPFAYRVLAPALVGALPVAADLGFRILTYTASFGVVLLMRRLLLRLGVHPSAALMTSALLGVAYPVAFYLGNWVAVDPLASLLGLAALLALVERRWFIALGALTIGCLVKETTLLLLPVAVWRIVHSDGKRRVFWLLSVIALPLLAATLVHRFADPAGDLQLMPGGLLQRTALVWAHNTAEFGPAARVIREVVRSYGFFWIVGLLGFGLMPLPLRLVAGYLLVVAAALCAVAVDWSRMLAWAFMAVFTAVGFFLDAVWRRRPRVELGLVLLAGLAIAQCYLCLVPFKELPNWAGNWLLVSTGLVTLAGAGVAIVLRPR